MVIYWAGYRMYDFRIADREVNMAMGELAQLVRVLAARPKGARYLLGDHGPEMSVMIGKADVRRHNDQGDLDFRFIKEIILKSGLEEVGVRIEDGDFVGDVVSFRILKADLIKNHATIKEAKNHFEKVLEAVGWARNKDGISNENILQAADASQKRIKESLEAQDVNVLKKLQSVGRGFSRQKAGYWLHEVFEGQVTFRPYDNQHVMMVPIEHDDADKLIRDLGIPGQGEKTYSPENYRYIKEFFNKSKLYLMLGAQVVLNDKQEKVFVFDKIAMEKNAEFLQDNLQTFIKRNKAFQHLPDFNDEFALQASGKIGLVVEEYLQGRGQDYTAQEDAWRHEPGQ
jgi:hypothetical protein